MKTVIIAIISFFFYSCVYAQNDESAEFNLLKSSNNTAFNMLGLATSEIEKPTELSAISTSIRSATNNFTAIPTNYAIEATPFLLFGKQLNYKNIGLKDFNSPALKNVFKQTFSLSAGMKQYFTDKKSIDSTSKIAFGFKTSLIRPRWTDDTQLEYNSLIKTMGVSLDEYTKLFQEAIANDKVYNQLNASTQKEEKSKRLTEIEKELQLNTKIANSPINITRKGWSMDFASAMMLDFPTNEWNYSTINKAGIWLTTGYENIKSKQVSLLSIARYMYHRPQTSDSFNQSSFDFGARVLLNDKADKKYTISVEAIHRYFTIEELATWRTVLNFEYAVSKNQRITLVLGRNYDGSTYEDGNILAAINFIRGIGNTRQEQIRNLR